MNSRNVSVSLFAHFFNRAYLDKSHPHELSSFEKMRSKIDQLTLASEGRDDDFGFHMQRNLAVLPTRNYCDFGRFVGITCTNPMFCC
jgi:hypothetical protein